MQPLISVIIPAYHAQSFIERPVLSVIKQNYPNWEIVIASDDHQDYEKILYDKKITDKRIQFTSTGNKQSGASVARNLALLHATGDIIAVLDADDEFAPHKFDKLLPFVLDYGAATSAISIVKTDTAEIFPSLAHPYPAGLLAPEHYIRSQIHGFSFLMWDRQRINTIWDESLVCMEDLIHGLSMYNVLDGIYFDPESLHNYFKHAKSFTNQIDPHTQHNEAAAKVIGVCTKIIERDRDRNLSVKNPLARDALVRYLNAMISLEKKFIDEAPRDPVMGYYHFIRQNRDAILNW